MVGSNKILTVSYGTFSCTLEGFDDSFDTMKAIAEYFRDLAADDRYFGAEPPTPDAEMLARIAEKEIARRVEARMETSGIVLRPVAALAAEPAPAVAEAAPAPAPEPVAEPVAEAPVEAPVTVAKVEVAKVEAEAPAMPPPAKLDSAKVESVKAEMPQAAPVAPKAEAPAAPMPNVRQAARVAPSESVSEKLRRIRAVVGKSTQGTEYIEDLPAAPAAEAPAEAPKVEAPKAEAPVAPLKADLPIEEPARPRTRVIRMKRQDFDRAVAAGALEEDKPAEAPVAKPVAEHVVAKAPVIEEPVEDADNLASLDGLDEFDIDASLSVEEEADFLRELADEDDLDDLDLDDEDEGDDELVAEDDDDLADMIARTTGAVETAKAPADDEFEDDLEAELAEEDDFEAELEEDLDDELDDEGENAFLDMDDAEYEGAEDEGEEPESLYAEEDEEEEAPAPLRVTRPGRALLDRQPEADEAGMSRILSRTDEQLREPEGKTRREAMSHLRGAVAATEAARRMGEDVDGAAASGEEEFRSDLDAVVHPKKAEEAEAPVRPRRAVSVERRSERPRPAPLKLVASQRIDVAEAAAPARPAMPVRPRRVAAEEVAAPVVAGSSFADFAREMGATELNEVLEAAAAYTSYVEGMEDFSRPQIMKKVAEVISPDNFNREDGLRSFGTLLRQGRIAKVRNGRFQVSEQTRFRPEGGRVARG